MGIFGKLFGRDPTPPSEVYLGLREKALTVLPDQIGLSVDPSAPIYGVVMETGADGSVSTFVCLGDGTVSLYLSTGGVIIGGGTHENVRSASAEMLAITNEYAADYLGLCQATSTYPLPGDGAVLFYLLTPAGVYQAQCIEDELVQEADPFANLFMNCHTVLAELRMVDEARRADA